MNRMSRIIGFIFITGLCTGGALAMASPSNHTELSHTSVSSVQPPAATDVFPVYSKRLSPGFIEARDIDMLGLNPVFLVGDDSLSRNWLRANKDRLQRLNATGLVVNVASPDALDDLRQLAENLRLIPVTGDDLARLLDLEHYPVLITDMRLE